MKTFFGLIGLTLSLMFTACEKDNMPEFNRLEGLRILAFQTATPEVNPGATVTVVPIVSDITATSLSFSATACLDPGLSYGADPTCEGNPSKVVIATNSALAAPGSSESWTGNADSFNVTIPADTVIFAGKTSSEMFNGVNYLIVYTLTNDHGASVTAVKRIVVSETSKTSKNQNPVTTQIFADGVAMTSLNYGAKMNLTTDLSLTSAESYVSQNAQSENIGKTEELTTTWFVTDGDTKYYRSSQLDADEFTAPSAAPAGRSVYIMAVTRDDRGGVSMVKKKF